MIYLDNAATSWPKPDVTWKAMERFMRKVGANPGRSGHRQAIDAARIILDARETVAQLFGVDDPRRIVFTSNATEALNIVFQGFLRPGDHVITSSLEHNSVMRPLRHLETKGVDLTVIPCSPTGEMGPSDVERAIRPHTRLIVLTHASNVMGALLPVSDVGTLARRHGVAFCVDAAQTAGACPVDVETMGIDFLAFTGHKSLCGPQGTGGLYIRPGLEKELNPLRRGGTGSRSELEEQPDFLPDKYESGTPNTVGIAGLNAGVHFVLSEGVGNIRAREQDLTVHIIEDLTSIPHVNVYGPLSVSAHIAVVSFNIDNMTPSEVAMKLDDHYHIMTRPGLHCAPSAHRTMATFPHGTVRFSPGYFTTDEDVATAVAAVSEIAAHHTRGAHIYARAH